MTSLRLKKRALRESSGLKRDWIGSKTKSTASLSEKQIETLILIQLNQIPKTYAWKNHTTGIYDPVRKTFRKLSGFSIKGVSDIIGIHKGRMICIEVKSEKGRLRPEQKDFLDRMTELGAICGVARSWHDVRLLLGCSDQSSPDKSAL